MENTATSIRFDEVTQLDIEEFRVQREKIHAAVHDKLLNTEQLREVLADAEKLRLSDELCSHILELFYTSVKYNLPQRLLEYVAWLQAFLRSRDFPEEYLVLLLRAIRQAAHAFIIDASSDGIGCVLHAIIEQLRKNDAAKEATA